MTEKRFTIIDKQFISYYGGDGHQISDGECTFWLWHNKEESQKVCDKLNKIIDENEQLRKENKELKKSIEEYVGINKENELLFEINNGLGKENEQLKQFKNTVFDCINKKIEEVDTIGAEVLKDLRRELIE